MSTAPEFNIDPAAFKADPYPILEEMRAVASIVYVPQLRSTLFLNRDQMFEAEKDVPVFSSASPQGIMTRLMGRNMMKQDGEGHMAERKALFTAFSPRTVRDVWTPLLRDHAAELLDAMEAKGRADLVADFALPVSGHLLRHITGLRDATPADIDRWSQAMIDGISNYAGAPEPETRCNAATAEMDAAVDAGEATEDAFDMISCGRRAGLTPAQIRNNVKLAISGGQNEPRDVIAGLAWALMTHPEARDAVLSGAVEWRSAFEEFVRWISPIGMLPRNVAKPAERFGVGFEPDEFVFFMLSAGNRDPETFKDPDKFDLSRDSSAHVAFGAGPHFCAGAAASRALIAEIALPMLFERFPDLRLDGDVRFDGWAFRGPLSVPVTWG